MLANITKIMSEKLTKMVPNGSKNLSKIDPGGGLEATWEPPLKQGASKTSLLTILAPIWDPLWDQFGFMLILLWNPVLGGRLDSILITLAFFWGPF